jgi:nicotinic acid mononucleotide adenylyltransferase
MSKTRKHKKYRRKKRYRRYTIRGSGKKTSKKETKKQKEEKMLSAYGRNIRKPKRYVPTIHSPKKRKEKGAVATFGRFQPFTVGHMGLIEKMIDTAFEMPGDYDIFVFLSNTKPHKAAKKDLKKEKSRSFFKPSLINRNPLHVNVKEYMMKIQLKGTLDKSSIINTGKIGVKNYHQAIKWLHKQNYNKVYMVLGQDRVIQVKKKLEETFTDENHKLSVVSNPRTEKSKQIFYNMNNLNENEKKTIVELYKPKEVSSTKVRSAIASHIIRRTSKKIQKDKGWNILKTAFKDMLSDNQIEELATITKNNMNLRLDKSYTDTQNPKISPFGNTRSNSRSESQTSQLSTIKEEEEEENIVKKFKKLKLNKRKEQIKKAYLSPVVSPRVQSPRSTRKKTTRKNNTGMKKKTRKKIKK